MVLLKCFGSEFPACFSTIQTWAIDGIVHRRKEKRGGEREKGHNASLGRISFHTKTFVSNLALYLKRGGRREKGLNANIFLIAMALGICDWERWFFNDLQRKRRKKKKKKRTSQCQAPSDQNIFASTCSHWGKKGEKKARFGGGGGNKVFVVK